MALSQDIDRLRRLPVFACLDGEALKLVAFSAEARRLPAGHVLFRRGEPAEAAVLLETGTLLNETALFAPGTQTATATAHEDCRVVSVPRALIKRVLDVYPADAFALRRYWAGRLGQRLARFKAAVPP